MLSSFLQIFTPPFLLRCRITDIGTLNVFYSLLERGRYEKHGERCLSDNIVAILESFTFEHLHKIIIAVENRGCFTFFMERHKVSPFGSYYVPTYMLYFIILHYIIFST